MSNTAFRFATEFYEAIQHGREVARPSKSWPGFTLDDAYAIQAQLVSRWEDEGDHVAAIKLGLTQQVQQDQFRIPHPTFGSLTRRALLTPGEAFSVSRGFAPKVEAELVVVLGSDITEIPASPRVVLDHIASIHAGIEILDSRFRDGVFHPLDGVADNQSGLSGVWSASGRPIDAIDMSAETVVLTVDGEVQGRGSGQRILGNPLRAVHGAIVERLRRGFPVFSGLVIFTGNLVEQAVPVVSGNTVTVEFSTLGRLTLSVVD